MGESGWGAIMAEEERQPKVRREGAIKTGLRRFAAGVAGTAGPDVERQLDMPGAGALTMDELNAVLNSEQKAERPAFGRGAIDDQEKDLIELSKVLGGDQGLFLRSRAPSMYESLVQMGEGLAQNIKKQRKFVSPEVPSQQPKKKAEFKSKEDVAKAISSGSISKDQGIKILREKFGMK